MVCRHRTERAFHTPESAERPPVQPDQIRLLLSTSGSQLQTQFSYFHQTLRLGCNPLHATPRSLWDLFLAILAGTIFLSVFLWVVDWVFSWQPSGNLLISAPAMLVGNIVHVLILFHLPATISSCYELQQEAQCLHRPSAPLSFALFSVIAPSLLLLRLGRKPTTKLYDETCALLALDPLYNHCRQDSQLRLAFPVQPRPRRDYRTRTTQ
jgi:hypothetical protein